MNMTTKEVLNLPRKWYSNQFRYELELLESYLKISQKEILISRTNYFIGKETYEDSINPENSNLVNFYEGVDDSIFDIDEIFNSYFPNIRRQNEFTLLISHLEYGTIQLCNNLASEFKVNFRIDRRKGLIKSVYLFLTTEMNLNFESSETAWKRIFLAYRIRNVIVHSSKGTFSDEELDEYKIKSGLILSADSNNILLNNMHNLFRFIEVELLQK